MSGFIAAASAPQSNGTVHNDGWFPDLSLADLRNATRLDGTVTDTRLREALLAAMSAVNDELADWRDAQEALGARRLEDSTTREIGGESRALVLYRRAVFCTVQADVLERYRDFDSSGSGQHRAEEQTSSIDDARRNARWATADLLGRRRSTVDLI